MCVGCWQVMVPRQPVMVPPRQPVMVPRQPPTPPPAAKRVKAAPPSPPPAAKAAPPAPPEMIQCPCCKGNGQIPSDIPAWASTVMTKESLHSTLKNNGVDDQACQQAIGLIYLHGKDGMVQVHSLISNLVKNWSYIDNPSAFVAAAAIRWKHSREPKSW